MLSNVLQKPFLFWVSLRTRVLWRTLTIFFFTKLLSLMQWYLLPKQGLACWHTWLSSLSVVPTKLSWAQFTVVKNQFREVADKLPVSDTPRFESTGEEDHHHHVTLFDDHSEGDEIFISPLSIPRMRVEKSYLSSSELRWVEDPVQLVIWCVVPEDDGVSGTQRLYLEWRRLWHARGYYPWQGVTRI